MVNLQEIISKLKYMENYSLLRTFMYEYEYLVIRTLFEKENINFFILNDTAIGLHPSIGGIKLLVHNNDLEKANNIISQCDL